MSENSQPKPDYFFDDLPVPKVVHIKTKEGVVKQFQLRHMGGPELSAWMELFARRVKAERDGNHDFDGFQAELITLCLYDENGSRVPASTIKAWHAHIQNGLYDLCQDMNGLTSDAREKAKKDSAR
jgi:protocatechuate 3,4-dioxygenase beta subunit